MAIVFGSDAGVQETTLESVWTKVADDADKIVSGLATGATSDNIPLTPKEPTYVDSGYENVPGTAFLGSDVDGLDDAKQRKITSQEPILTVYLKKRAFWAFRAENDLKYMDSSEKLFMRATKLLFEKKCSQIAAYEAMTKASRLISEGNIYDTMLVDKVIEYLTTTMEKIVAGLRESRQRLFNDMLARGISSDAAEGFLEVHDKKIQIAIENQEKVDDVRSGLKEIVTQNELLQHATHTNWVVDPNDADIFGSGRGVGVIELTMISSIDTSLSLNRGDTGSFNFTMEDPYNLTKITTDDVEAAITAAWAEMELIQEGETYVSENVPGQLKGPKYFYDEARKEEDVLRRLRSNNASREIIFEVDMTSSTSNAVLGFLAGSPQHFTSDDFEDILVGLTQEETQSIAKIFDLLGSYVSEAREINDKARVTNQDPDVTHARKNLRKHYLGKSIVQPMDSINIYMRGNTFKEDSFVGPLSAIFGGSDFVRKFQTDSLVNDAILQEEMAMFGIDNLNIPAELYRKIRTSTMLRNAGIHVFGGVVRGVTEDYSAGNGVYTTRVNGESNLCWLNLSRIIQKPDLTQVAGVLEDPLTPFDIVTDPLTGLIKDTPKLNSQNQFRKDNGLLFFDNTSAHAGEKLDETPNGNMTQDFEEGGEKPIERMKHASGLVYKWKNGILTATREVNLTTSLQGDENEIDHLKRVYGIPILENPFAGQDAANIVSILVTGFPHNYEAFYESALSHGTYNGGDETNTRSFFSTLFDVTRTTNNTFGRFEPVKLVKQDPKRANELMREQKYLGTESREINQLRLELANFESRRAQLVQSGLAGDAFSWYPDQNTQDANDSASAELERLKTSLDAVIAGLRKDIDVRSSEFKKKASKIGSDVGLRLYGNDAAFVTENPSEEESRKINMINHRIRNTIIQMRSQYDAKFNTDRNAFIIGDEYDKDIDLQAFAVEAIGSKELDMWKSEYKTPMEICDSVSETMDFEFFCDTQGHIQFRPPRYNKMPLSLLLKMLLIDQRQGMRVYPDALTALFKKRSGDLEEKIKVLDLEIEIEALILGGPQIVETNAAEISTAIINDRETIDFEIAPESVAGTADVFGDDIVEGVMDKRTRLRAIIGGYAPDPQSKEDRVAIENEIKSVHDPSQPNMYTKRLARINNLTKMASERTQMAETLEKYKTQRKSYGADSDGNTSQDQPTIMTMSNAEVLAPYEDLIEDDFNDLLGPGSAKRYIIYDDQIIQSSFSESDRNIPYTRIDVTGQQNYIGEGPGNIGGIPWIWAGATDFDMWRQYGYRSGGTVNKPFFDQPSQCAPYATMLLSRARMNAVVGNITIYGNEYYQLGDVVYINSRDMLFYVTAVRHQFSYSGGNFTTSLELKYGHPLGDYILTPLDSIGKALLKQPPTAPVTIRNPPPDVAKKLLSVPIGVVKFPVEQRHQDGEEDEKVKKEKIGMLTGEFAYKNVDSLKDSITIVHPHLKGTEADSYPKVEIRGFLTADGASEELVKLRMKAVRNWLKDPHGRWIAKFDQFIHLSDPRYKRKALQEGNMTNNPGPLDLRNPDRILDEAEAAKLPTQQVFNYKDNRIDNVIEIVLINEEVVTDE